MAEMNIDIKNQVTIVRYKNPDGTTASRSVSTADLCSVFANQVRKSSIVVPAGCRQVIEDNNRVTYVIVTPAYVGKCALRWGSNDTERYGALKNAEVPKEFKSAYDSREHVKMLTVPFPASAVAVQFTRQDGGKLAFRNMFAYAIKDINVPYQDMDAYHWPFTNMYSDCRVCIGNVPQIINNVDAVAGYPRYLYSGLGNHDLDSHFKLAQEELSLGKFANPYAFLKAMHDAKLTAFPVEYLHRIGPLASTVMGALGNH